MEVVLYTIGCPKCRVLEAKLKAKGISYTEFTDVDYMVNNGLTTLPYLEVNSTIMDFKQAVDWVNSWEGEDGNNT